MSSDPGPFEGCTYEAEGEKPKTCTRCGEVLRAHEAYWVPMGGPISGRPRSYVCIECYETQRRG